MKTRPFNASEYDPKRDKLVCGGDPVTELIVGDAFVAGIITTVGGGRYVKRWTSLNGKPIDSAHDKPLEVLIPEPEKPREWWMNRYSNDAVLHETKEVADRSAAPGRSEPAFRVREVTEPTPERDGEPMNMEGAGPRSNAGRDDARAAAGSGETHGQHRRTEGTSSLTSAAYATAMNAIRLADGWRLYLEAPADATGYHSGDFYKRIYAIEAALNLESHNGRAEG
jgi:hypothetical protein